MLCLDTGHRLSLVCQPCCLLVSAPFKIRQKARKVDKSPPPDCARSPETGRADQPLVDKVVDMGA